MNLITTKKSQGRAFSTPPLLHRSTAFKQLQGSLTLCPTHACPLVTAFPGGPLPLPFSPQTLFSIYQCDNVFASILKPSSNKLQRFYPPITFISSRHWGGAKTSPQVPHPDVFLCVGD